MYYFCKSLAGKEYNKSVNLKAVSCYICSGVGGSGGGGILSDSHRKGA